MKQTLHRILETLLVVIARIFRTVKRVTKNVKLMSEKITGTPLHKFVYCVTGGIAVIGSVWNICFYTDFQTQTTAIHMIFVIAIAYVFFSQIMYAIVSKEGRIIRVLFGVVAWGFAFFAHFVTFIVK